MKKTKQLENFFNSMTEDIFNMTEKEIDEGLTDMGYDPKKVGDAGWQLIKNLQKLKEAKNLPQAHVKKSVCDHDWKDIDSMEVECRKCGQVNFLD